MSRHYFGNLVNKFGIKKLAFFGLVCLVSAISVPISALQKSVLVPVATLEKSEKNAQAIESMVKRHRMMRYVGNGAVAALSIYWAGQFLGFWGRGEPHAPAPACAACLQAVAAPDTRGWGTWFYDGVTSAGGAVISPRWWGRKSYSLATLLAFTTCHTIMGNNIQNLVSKVYYPDTIHWFVLHKTTLRPTVFKLKYYAREIETQETISADSGNTTSTEPSTELENNKAMLKAMVTVLVGEVEKIAGFMLERRKALALDATISQEMVQLMITNVNGLVAALNNTGTLTDKQIEEFYWATLRTIDGFMGFSVQVDQANYKSLEKYEKQMRVKEELAVLPEEIRDTILEMTRKRRAVTGDFSEKLVEKA